MRRETDSITLRGMKRRLFAAALWFYAAWTFGAMLAWAVGLGVALGPVFGLVAAGVILRVPQLGPTESVA